MKPGNDWSQPTLFRLFGVPVQLHLTFLLFLAWFAWRGMETGGAAGALQEVAWVCAVFGCVTLHEFGHILAARMHGVRTQRVVLTPLGGVAMLEGIPRKPWKEIHVAVAGPGVNVAILLLCWAVGGFASPSDAYTTGGLSAWIVTLGFFNAVMLGFNMLPIYPMDGGRVLRAFLCIFMRRDRATWAAWFTALPVMVAAAIYIPDITGGSTEWILIIFGLMAYAGWREARAIDRQEQLRKCRAADLVVRDYLSVPDHMDISTAAILLRNAETHSLVVTSSAGDPTHVATAEDLADWLRDMPRDTPLHDCPGRPCRAVDGNMPAADCLMLMHSANLPLLPVELDGHWCGVIDYMRLPR